MSEFLCVLSSDKTKCREKAVDPRTRADDNPAIRSGSGLFDATLLLGGSRGGCVLGAGGFGLHYNAPCSFLQH